MIPPRQSVHREEETERTERVCRNDAAETESKPVDGRSGLPFALDWKVQQIVYAEESDSEY